MRSITALPYTAAAMNHSCSKVREAVSSTIRLHIEGFSITRASIKDDDMAICFTSRCHVDGHDWEIRFHPTLYVHDGQWYCPALDLVFLGESRTTVMATLSCKVIDRQVCYYGYEDYDFVPFKESKTDKYNFHSSLTVDCTVTVIREPAAAEGAIAVPSSDITQHLGELLCGKRGSDVTLFVARWSVFMAKFFTGKGENNSLQRVVEIQDMDAAVFKAMLRFIYTDEAPELDVKLDAAAMTFAQHLLIATGRYGLDRLKVMCERTIALGMDASTVASTFALAEQRNFPRLKAKCINFIAEGSLENLDAMLATEGYKNLFASSPMVLTELLKATHARKSTSNHNGWLQHLFRSTQTVTVRTMRHTSTQLTECVQSVHLLTINGFSVTKAAIGNNTRCIKSRCTVDGYNFEICLYPAHIHIEDVYLVALMLTLLGDTCMHVVEANLRGRLVEYNGSGVAPRESTYVSKVFKHPSDCTSRPLYIAKGVARDLQPPASLTVEYTITVFRDLKDIRMTASDLHQHLNGLLQSQAGADSFAAHKNILAARSPVFKAGFFGEMEEKTSQCVEIQDMEAQVFKAMLRFIYTDMVPDEFDNQPEAVAGTVMAQHLLVAADRFGLDRLKNNPACACPDGSLLGDKSLTTHRRGAKERSYVGHMLK
ncbi:hypothetical protein HU200_063407 [Digitaria exilis]|uniref:BTB domain-containing protein n=1 Tax=Digitaria exilis TaxID=1010633 RepID=A0A835A1M2_9POAL|nr:hypothetical protein HU200_063407 [Digitaria exilis]